LYIQCVKSMRIMFHKCRLVHADLSEFNMLFHCGKLYIIDVSQSVEHDHPHALEFLRMDCTNVTEFFGSKKCAGGIHTMSKVGLFNFIVRPSIPEEEIDTIIDDARKEYSAILEAEKDPVVRESHEAQEWKVAEATFLKSYIPRTLSEVTDCERDIFEPHVAPPKLYGIVAGLSQGTKTEEPLCLASDSDDEGDDGEGGEEEEEEEKVEEENEDMKKDDEKDSSEDASTTSTTATDGTTEGATVELTEKEKKKLARKEHKKEVKLAKRERRKEKAGRKEKEKEKRKIQNKQHSRPMGQ